MPSADQDIAIQTVAGRHGGRLRIIRITNFFHQHHQFMNLQDFFPLEAQELEFLDQMTAPLSTMAVTGEFHRCQMYIIKGLWGLGFGITFLSWLERQRLQTECVRIGHVKHRATVNSNPRQSWI